MALRDFITAIAMGFKLDIDSEASYRTDKQCRVYEDFLADAGATLPKPWTTQDTSAAGAPTLDYVADASSGRYRLKHAATDEQENITLYWGDQQVIPAAVSSKPVFETKITFTPSATLPTASKTRRFVIGLASARNATLDSIVDSMWIRIENSTTIYLESDDGTTDRNLIDSGISVSGVAATPTTLWFKIDASIPADVKFYYKATLTSDWIRLAPNTTFSMAASTQGLQPFAEAQKDNVGTDDTTDQLDIDYIDVIWQRA